MSYDRPVDLYAVVIILLFVQMFLVTAFLADVGASSRAISEIKAAYALVCILLLVGPIVDGLQWCFNRGETA